MDYYERRAQIKAQKAVIDADLEQRWQRVWRASSKSSKESEKQKRYAHEQCDLLRALEDLAATERTMYETSQSQGSGDDRLEAGSGEFGHVDCKFQRKREMSKDFSVSAKKVHQDSKNPST